MNKGMISALITLAFFLLPLAAFTQGQIYKIVDEDGNVTFTDQRPATGAEPMDLPPLSVIETDVPVPETPAVVADQEPKPPTSSELRKQFRDFAHNAAATGTNLLGNGQYRICKLGKFRGNPSGNERDAYSLTEKGKKPRPRAVSA